MREKGAIKAFSNREDIYQPAHLHSLIRAFCILQYPFILWVGNEGPDQFAQTRKLIRAFAGRIWNNDLFPILLID